MKKLLLLAFLPLAACASAQAKSAADRPVLDVPPVPPRVVEPIPAPPPERPPAPTGTGQDPGPSAPATNRQQKPAQPAAREAPKPDPKPEAPPQAEAPLPSTPSVPPLRTPNTASDGAEALRRARELIDRARKSLDAVDVRSLGGEQKEQYNQAKLFLTQSEDKLKTNDFELARSFADKAEQIARQLQKH